MMRLLCVTKEITKKDTNEKVNINEIYVELDNGNRIRVMPYVYEDKQGQKHSNLDKLVLVADKDLPF